MSTTNRSKFRTRTPVIRCCDLCGQPQAITPINEEHRKAHLSRQVAFVCQDCASRVRMEVEAAGGDFDQPKASA